MPYKIYFKNNGFFLKHTGLVTLSEINEVNGVIHGHKNFDEHKFQVIDLLNADLSNIDIEDADEPGTIDSIASKSNPYVKVAIIAVDEQTIKFCENYIGSAIQIGIEWKFRVFSNTDSAFQWIGVKPSLAFDIRDDRVD